MEYIDVKKVIKECNSKSDVLKKLKLHSNGRNNRKLNLIIENHSIDISHFDNGVSKRIKHKLITKECPNCGGNFKTKENSNKITCSYSCSNTYFRSGENHPNYRDINDYGDNELRTSRFSRKYRKICFDNHEHQCVVCGEDKILDVHHYDNNKKNNKPNNLIPICPTHHGYIHSEYKDEVLKIVEGYKKNYDTIN